MMYISKLIFHYSTFIFYLKYLSQNCKISMNLNKDNKKLSLCLKQALRSIREWKQLIPRYPKYTHIINIILCYMKEFIECNDSIKIKKLKCNRYNYNRWICEGCLGNKLYMNEQATYYHKQ